MKVLIPIVLAVILLQGCSSCNREQAQQASPSDSLNIAAGTDTSVATDTDQRPQHGRTIKKPLPYSGTWVNIKYLDELERTKSLRKSQSVTAMSYVQLPEFNNGQALIIWNFHEGTTYSLKNEQDKWFVTDEDDQRQVYSPIALGKDSSTLVIKDEVLKRVTTFNGKALIAETLLFGGTWQGDGMQVRFLSDGSIMGWNGYERYELVYDYMDAGLNTDMLLLKTSDGREVKATYRIKGSHMEITLLNCKLYDPVNGQCVEYSPGLLVASLKRIQEN